MKNQYSEKEMCAEPLILSRFTPSLPTTITTAGDVLYNLDDDGLNFFCLKKLVI